ncbi:MAG TPA: exonuclease SbcCD subunit D [Paenibacillaceae bacterium]
MRILHTGDWHFGRSLEGRSRLPEQEAFVDELVAIAREEEADLVLIAGDVYDSVNPPAAAEELYYDALSRLAEGGRRAVAVIAGNHDHPERIAAASPLASRHGIHLIGLPRREAVRVAVPRTGEEAVIAALPYPSESRLNELLHGELDEEALRAAYSDRVGRLLRDMAGQFGPDTVNLAMSHLYVLGGKESDSERPIQVGGAYTVHPDALDAGQQYTALGHLHRPQRAAGRDDIRYCGSPLAYSFSEAGQAKSVTLVEAVPGRPAAVREILLSSGRPLVRWEARGGLAEVYRWLDENRDPNAWIELEIWLEEALTHEQVGRLRAVREGIVTIRPVYTGIAGDEAGTAGERRGDLAPDELFRRFYRRQTGGAEPDEALVRLFLELIAEDGREEATAP